MMAKKTTEAMTASRPRIAAAISVTSALRADAVTCDWIQFGPCVSMTSRLVA